jgi:acetylornithine deacetylase
MDAVRNNDDIQLLSELVALDTTSCLSNSKAVDLACQRLDVPGIEVTRMPLDGGKENLIAFVGAEDASGDGLTLSGHLDCVPAGEGWKTDPLVLTELGGRLYGRGSCDMKGFDAIAINLLREAAGWDLKNPLALVLTCDEEIGCLGAKAVAEHWPIERDLPRNTLIGEPTSLQAVSMHKGLLKYRLVIKGAPGHTGTPSIGRNAIMPASVALASLEELRATIEGERSAASEAFHEVPYPVLSIVGVDGGSAWNVTPDRCEIRIGLRQMPGDSIDDWTSRLRNVLEGPLAAEEWSLELVHATPSMSTPSDAELYKACLSNTNQAADIGVSYGTDGAYLQQLGLACVVFGPGDIGVAHLPDEYMPVEEYAQGRAMIESLVREFCQ